MKRVRIAHEVNCSPEVFWQLYLDPVFTEALVREAIKVDNFKILKFEESPTEVHRITTGQPRISAPAAIQKIIGANFSYTEVLRFDRTQQVAKTSISLSTFGDKVRNDTTLRVEVLGPNRIRRIGDAEIEAKIFGMGGLIESNMEKQMQSGWADGAAFTNRWIAEHNLA